MDLIRLIKLKTINDELGNLNEFEQGVIYYFSKLKMDVEEYQWHRCSTLKHTFYDERGYVCFVLYPNIKVFYCSDFVLDVLCRMFSIDMIKLFNLIEKFIKNKLCLNDFKVTTRLNYR